MTEPPAALPLPGEPAQHLVTITIEADDALVAAIATSVDPRARRLRRWLTRAALPALEIAEWPGTRADLAQMVADAVDAVRPVE
jgi:hypothetical protein